METIIISINPGDGRSLQTAVERLIAVLDTLDGDPDFEPELGFTGYGAGHGSEVTDDREGDDEREWDQAENGIGDADALHSEEFMFGGWEGDGSGAKEAKKLLRRHGVSRRHRR